MEVRIIHEKEIERGQKREKHGMEGKHLPMIRALRALHTRHLNLQLCNDIQLFLLPRPHDSPSPIPLSANNLL